ncbi:MAG: transcriptional repressor [Dehalococcoidales bacterium]|nr:transcriptional repressor [Dehalococcoidales bacterium]
MKNESSGDIGQHNTQQRAVIKDILLNSKGHLNADEIYRQACQVSPGISLSTVYRNLRMFRKQGLVNQYQFGSRYFYEAAQVRHHHLVCLGCGRIFKFNCPSTENMKIKICREEGFKVTEADVRLIGYCPDCQKKPILPINKSVKMKSNNSVTKVSKRR